MSTPTDPPKKIYRDFDHWWREGNHGWSSASIDYARETWADFEPTILASRDDYKEALARLTSEHLKFQSEILQLAIDYAKEFARPDAPKFWSWVLEQQMSKPEEPEAEKKD